MRMIRVQSRVVPKVLGGWRGGCRRAWIDAALHAAAYMSAVHVWTSRVRNVGNFILCTLSFILRQLLGR